MRRSIAFLLVIANLVVGCGAVYRSSYLIDYRDGYLGEAEAEVSAVMAHEMPCGSFQNAPNAAMLLLDRATTRFAMGRVADAVVDYRQALEAIDLYSQRSPTEELLQTIGQDGYGAFCGDNYEQLLARLYLGLALLHEADFSNAYALLRQAQEIQEERASLYRASSLTRHYRFIGNPVAKLLFAALLEKRGDWSNAKVLYDQLGIKTLYAPHQAKVLIVCHNGNVPRRISQIEPASVASMAAVEFILQAYGMPLAISSFTGIPLPQLIFDDASAPTAMTIALDGESGQEIAYDIAQAASMELEDRKPNRAARAVARLAIRRSLVGVAQQQDDILGMLADVAMCVANATTQADTRSWRTLPWALELTSFEVSAGSHVLTIDALSGRQTFPLQLSEGDLCVINIFNMNPSVTTVLIPKCFVHLGEQSQCLKGDPL